MIKKYKKATLKLSNGMSFTGRLIGAPVLTSGEMVFSTGMLGYPEAMTDPSYLGQILVFSYCLIGNYGTPALTSGDFFYAHGHESNSIKVQGIIVSDIFDGAYHHDSAQSLETWMKSQNIPGIAGIDTRRLVQVIRESGTVMGRIVPEGVQDKCEYFNPAKRLLLPDVSVKEPKQISKGKYKIAVVDCGVKWNILRMLAQRGCAIELVPWNWDFSKISADAWLLSNGPGDPENTEDLVPRVREQILPQNKPVLGICLGHQILSLAAGAKTLRLAHGHRSHNQPVFSLPDKRAFMTSQNHRYGVDKKSIPKNWRLWFENANDSSVEGLKHKTKPFMSVQFHPEGSSGPNDTAWIIDEFIKLIK
jgi:carbamoyl-phosphate synthase small subunit